MNLKNLPTRTAALSLAGVIALTAALAGCARHDNSLGPAVPSGATEIGGTPMTSAPPPPADWHPHTVPPTSQQQAQDTLVGYLQRTLSALPPGTTLDATRYSGAGSNAPCDDNPTGPGKPPTEFSTTADLKLPAGIDPNDTIFKIGDTWKSWGWYVIERDGFQKPNRFGYAPDGNSLQVEAAYPPGSPPTVNGTTPCYHGELQRDDIPIPEVLRAN
jgi:hypothetical protein